MAQTPHRPNILVLCIDQWDRHMDLPPGVELPALEQLGELPVFGGNSGELLHEYAATIDRMAADIDDAARFVHMVFYIFADDASGDRVASALERAAARGVTCRVLVDALGSRTYLIPLAYSL